MRNVLLAQCSLRGDHVGAANEAHVAKMPAFIGQKQGANSKLN